MNIRKKINLLTDTYSKEVYTLYFIGDLEEIGLAGVPYSFIDALYENYKIAFKGRVKLNRPTREFYLEDENYVTNLLLLHNVEYYLQGGALQ